MTFEIDLSRKIEWDSKECLWDLERNFDLVPGDDNRWYLWWRAERTWIAAFPTQAIAENFLLGDWTGEVGNPGWDRSNPDDAVDIIGALYRYREKHGRFPQFELDASSTMIAFFTRIDTDLGFAFLSNLLKNDEDITLKPDVFHPLVAQHLAAGRYGLEASSTALLAPRFTELLIQAYFPRQLHGKRVTN